MRKHLLASVVAGLCASAAFAASEAIDPAVPAVLGLREQAALRDSWLLTRLDTLVPQLMRREGIDM